VTFDRPDLLVIGPLLALAFAVALGWRFRRLRRLAQVYDVPALARLLPAGLDRFPTSRLLCLVASATAIGLAAAGPGWEVPGLDEPLPPLDVAIAVDLSLSMSATDAAPSRIARAREVIALLSEELPSVRFSMVAFAGFPYALLPPTDDPTILRYFSQSLDVGLVLPRDRGTAVGDALALAGYTQEARPTPDARRLVLLFSDGDTGPDDPVVDAAAGLASTGVQVWVAGLGSTAGSAIFVDGAPLLDGGGAPVVATMNETLLRAVAEDGEGRYFNVSSAGGSDALLSDLRELSGDREGVPPPPVDAAFLLVLLAVPLLLWEGAADRGRGLSAARFAGSDS
jgi:Ca-activated chloride channel family protein